MKLSDSGIPHNKRRGKRLQVTRETHLKLAFITWGLVGSGLLIAGAFFLFGDFTRSDYGMESPAPGMTEGIGLVIGLALGFIKGNFVLRKIARKYSARIKALPETSPVYMTFSPKSWIMVLGMILLGRTIRALGAPHLIIGVIYVAVGFALIMGCRTYIAGPHSSQT